MDVMKKFIEMLDDGQRDTFLSLNTPAQIQAYLDSIPYSGDSGNRSPLTVLRDRKAHCLDGGLFAAAALRHIGYRPILIDMLPVPGRDDDHVLAVFKRHGHWGCVAKSNFVGLRYRDPVYRSFRELVLSYFDVFFNAEGEKTMRGYTVPLYLKTLDKLNWMWDEKAVDFIEKHLTTLRSYTLLTPEMIEELIPMDERSLTAGMMGVNLTGLYKPH
jgi:hypothetical protein